MLGALVLAAMTVLWVAKLMATEIVKREYDSWAPALARAVVHIGCRLHPARADEWQAELIARQAEGAAGVDYAVVVALGGCRFAARTALNAIGRRRRRRVRRAALQMLFTIGSALALLTSPLPKPLGGLELERVARRRRLPRWWRVRRDW